MEPYEDGSHFDPLKNKQIIDFSININPLGLSPLGKKGLEDSLAWISHYPDPEYKELKEALSFHHHISPSSFYVRNGSVELLYQCLHFLKPHKTLIVGPTFVEYEKALKSVESLIFYFLLNASTDFELSLQELKKEVIGFDTIILCSPHNPTGRKIPHQTLYELLSFLKENNIFCIINESFIDFCGEEYSCVSFCHEFPSLFILRSATKFFAIPGLRLGYAITSNLKFFYWHKTHTCPWVVNVVASHILIHSLKDKSYIEQTKKYVQKERDFLFEEISKIPYFKTFTSHANYLLIQYTKNNQLKEFLLKKNILIKSCDHYIGLGPQYYRIAIKKEEENKLILSYFKEV